MITVIIFAVIAYLIGSVSSAIIVCKLLNLPDPRTQGSMNPGTTNVLRIGGKIPALLTLIGDIAKGFIPVLFARIFGISGFSLGLIALAAFLGHIYPIFFKFQGGKGVATSLGVFLALSPITGILAFLCWLTVAYMFRYSSLASLASAALVPLLILFFADVGYLIPTLAITGILIWRHWGNIQRLRAGTEGKINFESSVPSSSQKTK